MLMCNMGQQVAVNKELGTLSISTIMQSKSKSKILHYKNPNPHQNMGVSVFPWQGKSTGKSTTENDSHIYLLRSK